MLILTKLYAILHCFFFNSWFNYMENETRADDSIFASPYKNELFPDTELELHKVGFSQIE